MRTALVSSIVLVNDILAFFLRRVRHFLLDDDSLLGIYLSLDVGTICDDFLRCDGNYVNRTLAVLTISQAIQCITDFDFV
jgi:hypothetical protein